MKRLLLIFLLAWMGAALLAQQATPVFLISAQGKVCYKSPDKKQKDKAVTGGVYKKQGMLSLKKNATVTLYCDGKFVDKTGKQTLNLAEVFPEGNSMVKNNFDLTFGDYTVAAFMMAAASKDKRDGWGNITNPKSSGDGWGTITNPKSSGDGWGTITNPKSSGDGWGTITNPKSSGDGWGGKGLGIAAIQPFGKIFPRTMRFFWSKPAGAASFHFVIRNKTNQLIQETTTLDTFIIIDLKAASFKIGDKYDWLVETVESSPKRSNTLTFEIGEQEGHDKAVQATQKGELFGKSPEEIKLVMQAVALETSGWFEEASRLYEQAQSQHPKNEYVKLMHAAFWIRSGLTPKARAVYR